MQGWRALTQRQASLFLQQCRGYAKEVTVLAGDAAVHTRPKDPTFLRFATPVPQPYNHSQVLGYIPETRVCYAISTYLLRAWSPSSLQSFAMPPFWLPELSASNAAVLLLCC